MKYSLDTNTCIRIINRRSESTRIRLYSIDQQDVIVCSIVRAELLYGAAKSQTPLQTRQKQLLFLQPFESLAFDDASVDAYAHLRADLERKGTPIGSLDMLIAAIALAHNLTLVTHNVAEFSRIPHLKLTDWEV